MAQNDNMPNFCTQAIEDLTAWERTLRMTEPLAARNILQIIRLLEQAVKFYMPDNGRLFDDGLRALPAVFRLPYPVLVAEFRMLNQAPAAHQPLAAEQDLLPSSKRIALAFEVNQGNIANYQRMIHPEYAQKLGDDGGIAIIPVYFNDRKQRWDIPPYGALTPCHKVTASTEDRERLLDIYGGSMPKGMKEIPLECLPIFLLPETGQALFSAYGLKYVHGAMVQDTNDEFISVLELVEILACRNVATVQVEPPKALNKKRASKGKPPFFEYKVLVLEQPTDLVGGGSPRGSHASPRVHLRRGHIRRLPDKSIWVNATVVGNKQAGVVMKDYAMKVRE